MADFGGDFRFWDIMLNVADVHVMAAMVHKSMAAVGSGFLPSVMSREMRVCEKLETVENL